MITLHVPCALKNCLHYAEVELRTGSMPQDAFALCRDCEDAVVINVLAEVVASGNFPQNFTQHLVSRIAAWRRVRKGVVLPHRRLTTTVRSTPAPELDTDRVDFAVKKVLAS